MGELEQVVGMTPALLERLRPLMTVYSRFGVINPSAVSLPVALALAGITNASATLQDLDILQLRLNLPPAFTSVPRTRGTVSTASNTYAVRVAVDLGHQARFTREAIVELKPTNDTEATIKDWTERDSALYGIDPPATEDTPPCIGGLLSLDPP